MSIYFIHGKGWRYDFTLKGIRYTEAWFRTKTEARKAEAKRKEEIDNQKTGTEIPTDMGFLELVNRRLDHVKAYNSHVHYRDYVFRAKRWVKRWEGFTCGQITQEMIQGYILERSKVSSYTANKEIRYLRATFNFGRKRKFINQSPVDGIEFLPVEKKLKYVPPPEDLDKVISCADIDTQDYLWTIRETLARIGEINRLTWNDVDLHARYVILYTRKKRGGHLTPRKVWMTEKLFKVLSNRSVTRDPTNPWVFDNSYRKVRTGSKKDGPFVDRRGILESLCKKAGVKRFTFHTIRHSGASIMDNNNVPIGAIQRILGHENRTTTEIYLHSMDRVEREAMAIYEQARENSHTQSHTDPP